MNGAWAIAKRELASFFRLPLGWIVVALFLFLSAISFTTRSLIPGEPASLRDFFSLWWSMLMVIAPAISMRLVSEETRTGTIEPLLTSPASEAAVALGKYAGALLFLLLCLLPTLALPGVLVVLASPDPGPIVTGYLGMVLLGMAYLAVGLLFSTLTSSQTLAFLGTLFFLMLVEIGAQRGAPLLPAPLDEAVASLSMSVRLLDFARGIIDTSHVAFFLAVSAWFVAMSALALRIRRWR